MSIVKSIFPTIVAAIIFAGIAAGQTTEDCPKIRVIGPSGITTPGDSVTFVIETDADIKDLRFNWTVTAGVIDAGQGTPSISVRSSREDSGETIEATVEVSGLPGACDNRARETAPIDNIPVCGLAADEFGDLEPNDVRARMDQFFVELENNPTNQGVVLLIITDKEELSELNPRLQLIVKHAAFREFDLKRLTFMFEIADRSYTRLWRVLPGAESPCPDCIVVNAVELP
jgi:hypothetical protein